MPQSCKTMKWEATEHEYETEVISTKEKELAKQIANIITSQLKWHTNPLKKPRDAVVYIPFRKIIFEPLLPKKKFGR